MNNKIIVGALWICSACFSTAYAADGTINFTGTITDAACTITPGSANQTVSMGTVSSTALANVGDTAAPSAFNIVLTNCPVTATQAVVKFDGPTDADNSSLIALTTAAGKATGVAIGVYEADAATLIPVGSPSASKTLSTTADTTFNFFAKYVATNAVVAGSANAVSDFTVIYN